jgi:hypothetical protein
MRFIICIIFGSGQEEHVGRVINQRILGRVRAVMRFFWVLTLQSMDTVVIMLKDC